MRSRTRSLLGVALIGLGGAAALVSGGTASNPGWEKLKSLAGDWEGVYSSMEERGNVSVSYRLVSNESTLMETMKTGHDTDMITMYVPDGDRLVAIHYCSEGNQPRMRAEASAGSVQKIDFRFVDATNLSGPDAMHMRSLVVTFEGPDRFQQEWTSRGGGKDHTGIFRYTRKK